MRRSPFDFDGDGEMSSFEKAAEFAFWHGMVEENADDDCDSPEADTFD